MEDKKYPIPEIGKTYNCFDDGKITDSRRYQVEITNIYPFEKMPPEAKWLWENGAWGLSSPNVKDDEYHLFAYPEEQDFIVQGISYEKKDYPEICFFARTSGEGWFGLGAQRYDEGADCEWYDEMWGSGRLDVTGELWDRVKKEHYEGI